MASKPTFMDIAIGLDPNSAWDVRWIFLADMNRDGYVTISDFWLWIKWVFYAPGDWILLMLMMHAPSFSKFMEITTAMLYGWWSFFLSLFAWYLLFAGAFFRD